MAARVYPEGNDEENETRGCSNIFSPAKKKSSSVVLIVGINSSNLLLKWPSKKDFAVEAINIDEKEKLYNKGRESKGIIYCFPPQKCIIPLAARELEILIQSITDWKASPALLIIKENNIISDDDDGLDAYLNSINSLKWRKGNGEDADFKWLEKIVDGR